MLSLRTLFAIALAAIALGTAACGGPSKPPRGVIESDLDGWTFRRYQSLLDVEVWVTGNDAVGHTASYARTAAEKRGELVAADVTNAFVTQYQKKDGVTPALIRFAHRLSREFGYEVTEREIEDVNLIEIRGTDELWVMWPSGLHLVKLGGQGHTAVVEPLIEAYGERYPSSLATGALDRPVAEEPTLEPPPPADQPDWDNERRKGRSAK